MATFTLPKNSKISGKGRAHSADGAGRVKKFKIYQITEKWFNLFKKYVIKKR